MGEEKIGQGKENTLAFLESHPEIAADIEQKLRDKLFPGQVLKTKEGVPVKREPRIAPKVEETKAVELTEKGKAEAKGDISLADGLF